MIEKINKTREYLDYIEQHYLNVQKAWELINQKCGNEFRFMHDDFVWHSIDSAIQKHDMSKLSSNEFIQYRERFFPCSYENDINKNEFESAWEHHKRHNDHHWQNWTINHKNNPYADIFVVHMAVDWIAMSIKYNNSALDYYNSIRNEIKLPNWANELVIHILNMIYLN